MPAAAPDPALALLVFAGLLLAAALVAWPRYGLVARYRRAAQLSERVQLEDGVKHLYKAEASGHRASIDSLAGALGVSRDRAVEILRALESLDLARLAPDDITLTDDGRAHALRIVRTHRIWERYLADRTGVAPEEWHAQAERVEHGIAPAEVERLSASMGHPVYDPHGDPIPTAAGELPPARGVPLNALPDGTSVTVVHIEDEPEEVYKSLRAAGIDVGDRLRLDRVDPTSLQVSLEGRQVSLEPIAARNLTVEVVDAECIEPDLERLDALRPGEEGVVVRLGWALQGAQRRRLLDLGLVAGAVVRAELRSMSGDPVAYRIRGAVIALRGAQAREILIRRRPREEAA